RDAADGCTLSRSEGASAGGASPGHAAGPARRCARGRPSAAGVDPAAGCDGPYRARGLSGRTVVARRPRPPALGRRWRRRGAPEYDAGRPLWRSPAALAASRDLSPAAACLGRRRHAAAAAQVDRSDSGTRRRALPRRRAEPRHMNRRRGISATLAAYLARQFLGSLLTVLLFAALVILLFDGLELLRRAAGQPEATMTTIAGMALLRLPAL